MKVEIPPIITMAKIDKYHNNRIGLLKIDQEAVDQARAKQLAEVDMLHLCLEFSTCKIRM